MYRYPSFIIYSKYLDLRVGFYATVGCHPTRSAGFDTHTDGPEGYLKGLDDLLSQNLTGRGRVVALGELGLGIFDFPLQLSNIQTSSVLTDYDRTNYASKDVQKKYFRMQLNLAKKHHLPMFLHSRSAHADFVEILSQEGFGIGGGKNVGGAGGVVHSFTGTVQEAQDYVGSLSSPFTEFY
jgi:TatD DNase family protein